MLTQTAEYALRAGVALASAGSSLTTAEIAERTQVPLQYLSKVLQGLSRAGLVTALRGKYGGYRLGRDAAQVSVLDILNATSPLERIRHCPLGLPGHAALCPLHQHLDDALATLEAGLRGLSLAALTGEADQAVPGLDGLAGRCLGPGRFNQGGVAS